MALKSLGQRQQRPQGRAGQSDDRRKVKHHGLGVIRDQFPQFAIKIRCVGRIQLATYHEYVG